MQGIPWWTCEWCCTTAAFHPVDSSGMSFEIAGSYAARKGLSLAQPVLLEPVMRAEVKVPDAFTGDVTGRPEHQEGRASWA